MSPWLASWSEQLSISKVLAGRMNAVNREFVYIDFDDERFPPCEGGEEVSEMFLAHFQGPKTVIFLRFFKVRSQKH